MNFELLSRLPNRAPLTPSLLFVHGPWHGVSCWDEFFRPYFAQHGYIAYALSLLGHGASEGRELMRGTSIAEYVEDVAQVAQHRIVEWLKAQGL